MPYSANVPAVANQDTYLQTLDNYEAEFVKFIGQLGLPNKDIFTDSAERMAIFRNIELALSSLPPEQRNTSVYISKFLAASMHGLFDAALNYLWDETISEIRKRVISYDISYFYDNCSIVEEKRKKLSSPDDIVRLDDSELIIGARNIGLISEIGYRHLDNIRFMRNWASAAHPNQNKLTGLQLISWFETCIREVISLPMSTIVTEIKKLLFNIKQNTITEDKAKQIAVSFKELDQQQANNLALGFSGIYVDDSTTPQTRQNIYYLLKYLWGYVDDETKYIFGVKYGKFIANNEESKAILARQFLEIVDALSYIPEGLLASEIDSALQNLLSVHRAFNNVYSEPVFAKQLASLIHKTGVIPKQIRKNYVIGLIDVFLTNGAAEAWYADPYYKEMINKFSQDEAIIAMLSFTNERISSKLQFKRCQDKYWQLMDIIRPKLSASSAIEVWDYLKNFHGPLDKMAADSRIMQKIKAVKLSMNI